MQRLVVVRHAEAEGQAETDHARVLTGRGQRDAEAAAAWIAGHGGTWRVLTSPAARAQQTAAAVARRLGVPRVDEEPLIYEAEVATLLRVVGDQAGRRTPDLVLVGHNPGLEDLVHVLAGPAATGPLVPAGCVLLDASRGIAPGRCRMLGRTAPSFP